MSKLITAIAAEVEFVTGEKHGDYGLYRSVLFLTPDGEKIWKSFAPDSPELEQLTPRTKVRLIPSGKTKSGKTSHVIELVDAAAPAAGLPTDQKREIFEQKHAIAAYVEEQTALYAFCFEQAKTKLGEVTEDTVRCAASTVYIAAQRKFGI